MGNYNLLKRINDAFNCEEVPSEVNILDFWVQEDPDARTLVTVFAGKSWKEVSPADLVDNQLYLFYLSDEAFHYYMPAFLSLVLDDLNNADLVSDVIVRQLAKSAKRLQYFTIEELFVLDNCIRNIGAREKYSELDAALRNVEIARIRLEKA